MTWLWMLVLTGVVGLRLSVIDLAEHRLPNRLTIPLFFSVVALSVAGGDVSALRDALSSSVLSGLVFLALALLPGRPLGLGDVKLQFSLGWVLGFADPALAMMGAAGSFVLGGLSVLPRLMVSRLAVGDHIPLGPWMLVSTGLVVLGAESLKII
jgi:leader peptidase (prepilin peptidase)/N-methyltransferase